MPSLRDRLRDDLTTAMKNRDEVRVAALRMALTAVSVEQASGTVARTLSDDEVVAVLSRESKKRREAADAFEQAGRAESAQRERDEQAVLATYLPASLTDAELDALVADAVAEARQAGATGGAAMGAVMKRLQPTVRGRADGADVARRVKAALGLAERGARPHG
jgi:uncharacterized protein YqeY